MFTRSILNNLRHWKNKPNRKPLILRGARQVGKTTIVNIFAKEFDNYIYLNLELKKDSSLFDENLAVEEVFESILLNKNIVLKPGSTLLFIDEIQNSPGAVQMLRYFYEKMPHIHVIAAGSLLEILLARYALSFPVGRVEYLYMYPLTFREFLQAQQAAQLIDIYDTIPLPLIGYNPLLTAFHRYTMIGGMPEVIQKYIKDQTLTNLSTIYESLIGSYIDDAEKYARNNSIRHILRHCIEVAPKEAGNRIKFHGFGNSNYRSREVGEALRTLERAMLIYIIYPSTAVQMPLMNNQKKSPKLQFIDTGLINYFVGLQPQFYKYDDLHAFYKGIIAEHIVRQQVIASDFTHNRHPSFWVRESATSNAEVDLLIQHEELIIPVEVKAGKTGNLRSLHQFVERANHPYAVRLYRGNLEVIETRTPGGKPYKLLNLPYFLASKLNDYIGWFVK